jgi:hypothetical protein
MKPTDRPGIQFIALITATMIVNALLAVTVAAQDSDNVTPLPELTHAFNQVQQTTLALETARAQNDVQAIQNARQQHQAAQEQMQQSLAITAGVNPGLVAEMQAVGMGWGQICQELGLNPGLMKLAHDQNQIQNRTRNQVHNMARNREHLEATSRQMHQQTASKHGMAAIGFGGGKTANLGVHQTTHDFTGAGMGHGAGFHGGMGGGMGGDAGGHGGFGSGGRGGGMGGDAGGHGGSGSGGMGGGMGGDAGGGMGGGHK